MAYQFPKDPCQWTGVLKSNSLMVQSLSISYNEAQNTWELAGQGVDLDQNNIVIYTDNVLARSGSRPAANERNANYQG